MNMYEPFSWANTTQQTAPVRGFPLAVCSGRRAQFEILGLAIVIVIIAFATLFFFVNTLGGDETEPLSDFRDDQYTQNLVDALPKTSLYECQGTWDDYLEWIANERGPLNPRTGTLCADEFTLADKESLRGVQVLKDLLDATTQYRGQHYFLQYKKPTPTAAANPELSATACRVYDARASESNDCDALFTLYSEDAQGNQLCDPTKDFTSKAAQSTVVLSARPRRTAELALWLCDRS